MDRMNAEDQSFEDLMEVCGKHFKRSRPNEEDNSFDHRRSQPGPRRPSRSLGSGSAEDGSLLVMLAKLILR